ncbi:MAG: peptidyl-prolyl cis-trans isomerase [Terriglobales bacterium]
MALTLLLVSILAAMGHAQEASPSASPAALSVKTAASPSERVVIKVGNLQLTEAEFESILATLEEQQGPATLSRRTIGENYASLLMLAQLATANHLDATPDVIRQLAIDRNQILSNAEFAQLKNQVKPTAEEIDAYYSAHGAEYDVVDLRRLFVWQNSTGSKTGKGMPPREAQALIAAVRQAFASGGDAAKLVQGKKDVLLDTEPSTFQRGELPPKLNEAAFGLPPGQWSVVEQTPDALVLIYVVKRYRRELHAVLPIVEKKLTNQKLRSEMENLKKSTGLWLDDEYFGAATAVSASGTQPNPPAPTNSVKEKRGEGQR